MNNNVDDDILPVIQVTTTKRYEMDPDLEFQINQGYISCDRGRHFCFRNKGSIREMYKTGLTPSFKGRFAPLRRFDELVVDCCKPG